MAPKRIWKNLDEFYGNSTVEQARKDEFDPAVASALKEIREGDTVGSSNQEADADLLRENLPGFSRRGFLQLSGAATVFGLAGCWHSPPPTLVPYQQHPEGHILGKANYFSTTLRDGGKAVPIMAKTYDFRPIKLEGNPDSSWSHGRLDVQGQAALLNLYDPDRLYHTDSETIEGPLKKDGEGFVATSWSQLDSAAAAAIKTGTVGLLTPPVDGPAHAALLDTLKSALGDRLRHVAYDPFAADRVREARGICFGAAEAKEPVYHADKAEVLVTLGSDFIGGGQTGLYEHVTFGDQRRLKSAGAHAEMGSFIAFEPMMTQSGACADIRSRVAMEDIADVGWAIAVTVAEKLGKSAALPAWAGKAAERGAKAVGAHPVFSQLPKADKHPYGPDKLAGKNAVIQYTADQLVAAAKAGKHSLVYAGGANHTGANSLPILIVANVLNSLLGNEGVTVETATSSPSAVPGSLDDTRALLAYAAAGKLGSLILVDVNPVHALGTLAEDALAAVAKAGGLIACSDRIDESSSFANWFAPTTHGLESWGDAEIHAGSYSLQQPVILPLWDVRQWQESLLSFLVAGGLGGDAITVESPEKPEVIRSAASRKPVWVASTFGVKSWQSIVLEVWGSTVRSAVGAAASAKAFVRSAQARGVVEGPAPSATAPTLAAIPASAESKTTRPADGSFSLVLNASRTVGDGRNANNPWLQETPDPVTKVTWDTWLSVNITDAKELMLGRDSVATLTVNNKTVKVPVMVQPGQDRGCAELFLGFGRKAAGPVAAGGGVDDLQVNGFKLAAGDQRWGLTASIEAAPETYKLACTQYHQYMDGRNIALDDVLELHQQDAAFNRYTPHIHWEGGTSVEGEPNQTGHNLSLFNETIVYPGRRWGMVIDMNSCTGCNACVVACSAENNVPVVGRDEVRIGREMHWIRIDRYYTANSISKKDSKYKGVADSEVVAQEDPEDVEVIHQPMVCQQCGHAPCEEVCPAMATMHNDEGINVQVYNRCIGTRYCANNCPYKVRRFNFYEYSKYRFGPHGSGSPLNRVARNLVEEGSTSSQAEMMVAPLHMVLNPALTLRSKGVMEKCNFCLQRTREVREEEKRTNKRYEDGSVTTACAQTCPTRAIVFGDINDPSAEVSTLSDASPHRYKVLDPELNTRPSVNYLRKIRNRPSTADESKYVEKLKYSAKKHDEEKPSDQATDGAEGGDH